MQTQISRISAADKDNTYSREDHCFINGYLPQSQNGCKSRFQKVFQFYHVKLFWKECLYTCTLCIFPEMNINTTNVTFIIFLRSWARNGHLAVPLAPTDLWLQSGYLLSARTVAPKTKRLIFLSKGNLSDKLGEQMLL